MHAAGCTVTGTSRKGFAEAVDAALTEPPDATPRVATVSFADDRVMVELAWNLAWFALIPIGALLKRRNSREE